MGRGERQYDIIAVSLQDAPGDSQPKASWLKSATGAINPKHAKSKSGVAALTNPEHVYVKAIVEHLGKDYALLVDSSLIQMRLVVLVLESHIRHITDLEQNIIPCSSAAPKGIAAKKSAGAVLGDKGALAAKFLMHGTSLCFVGTHLPTSAVGSSSLPAATVKAKAIDKLNRDCEAIMGVPLGNQKLDVGQFHHTFWFGDLNYKLDLSLQDGAKQPDQAKHFEEVCKLIDNRQWDKLSRADQLADQMSKRKVFHEWEEEEKDFPPTFKIAEGGGYDPSRIPSWNDRVLWHSLPGTAEAVECMSYSSVEGMDVGDHRPVMASFQLQLRPTISLLTPADPAPPLPSAEGVSENVVLADTSSSGSLKAQLAGQAQMCVLQMSGMRCTIPRAGEGVPTLQEPYLMIMSDPPALLGAKTTKRPPRSGSGTVSKDATGGSTCAWDSLPKLVARVGTPQELASCHLHLAMYDSKKGASTGAFSIKSKKTEDEDRYIGHVSISLDSFGTVDMGPADTSDHPSFSFEADVLRLGKPAGTITGVLTMVAGHTALPSMSQRVAAGAKSAKELPGKTPPKKSFEADEGDRQSGYGSPLEDLIDPLVDMTRVSEVISDTAEDAIDIVKDIREKAVEQIKGGLSKMIGGGKSGDAESMIGGGKSGDAESTPSNMPTAGTSLRERAAASSSEGLLVDARLPHFELNKKEWLISVVAALSFDDAMRLKSLYSDHGSASTTNLDLRVQQCGADASGRCYGSIRGQPGCVLTAGTNTAASERGVPLQSTREEGAARGVQSFGLGDTILHLASRNDKRRSVLALLAVGADPRSLNREGRPPRTVSATIECRLEFVHHHKPDASVRQREMHGLQPRVPHADEHHYCAPLSAQNMSAAPASAAPVSAAQLFKKPAAKPTEASEQAEPVEPAGEEMPTIQVEVTLKRHPEKGLGLILDHDGDGEVEILVGDLVEGSPAFECGKIELDDELIAVNGTKVYGMKFAKVLELLAPDEVDLVFERELMGEASFEEVDNKAVKRRGSNANLALKDIAEAELLPEGEMRSSGRLLKKGHGKGGMGKLRKKKGWKMRYFVIDKGNRHLDEPPTFKYYKPAGSNKKLGAIPIKGCTVEAVEESKHEFHFIIRREEEEAKKKPKKAKGEGYKEYQFRAASKLLCEQWVAAIKDAVDTYDPAEGPSTPTIGGIFGSRRLEVGKKEGEGKEGKEEEEEKEGKEEGESEEGESEEAKQLRELKEKTEKKAKGLGLKFGGAKKTKEEQKIEKEEAKQKKEEEKKAKEEQKKAKEDTVKAKKEEAKRVKEEAKKAKEDKKVEERAKKEGETKAKKEGEDVEEEVLTTQVEVTLKRHPEKGLGLILDHDGDGEVEILVGDLVEGSPAFECGKIEVDDELIAVNGTKVYGMKFAKVLELLAPDEVHLVLEREADPDSAEGGEVDSASKRRGLQRRTSNADVKAELMMEGSLLTKARGKIRRNWKRRYFILDIKAGKLKHYHSKKSQEKGKVKKSGELELKGCEVSHLKGSKHENHFQVMRPRQEGDEGDDDDDEGVEGMKVLTQLRADDYDSMTDWMSDINKAIEMQEVAQGGEDLDLDLDLDLGAEQVDDEAL
jgi:hypothetical protein